MAPNPALMDQVRDNVVGVGPQLEEMLTDLCSTTGRNYLDIRREDTANVLRFLTTCARIPNGPTNWESFYFAQISNSPSRLITQSHHKLAIFELDRRSNLVLDRTDGRRFMMSLLAGLETEEAIQQIIEIAYRYSPRLGF